LLYISTDTTSQFAFDYPQFQTNALPVKPRIEVISDGTGSRSSSKRQHSKTSTSSLDGHLQASDSPTNRRLTPVLTITLPSTEELRADQQLVRSSSKPPPSPQTEDRHHKISAASVSVAAHHVTNGNTDQATTDDTSSKCDQYRRQVRWLPTSDLLILYRILDKFSSDNGGTIFMSSVYFFVLL
jgi:hypothetical protein